MKSKEEYLDSIYKKQEIHKKELKQKRNRRKVMFAATSGIVCLILVTVYVLAPLLSNKNDKYVVHAANLMKDFESEKTAKRHGKEADEHFENAYADFAINLFKSTVNATENVMVSPLSVYIALAMTANGANGETLEQMENVFGMGIEDLNAYMISYAGSLSSTNYGKFNIANSVWFKNDGSLKVNDEFLQTNADYYMADAYASAFDEKTPADINSWVKQKTDGLIEKVIDEIPPMSVMYLINTVLFDAEWEKIYESYGVSESAFICEDGSSETVDFLNSIEGVYLECEDAVGIIKPYKNKQYSFVALLPDDDINVDMFVRDFTGDKWFELIENKEYMGVVTAIPKFEYEYTTNLNETLIKMGMPYAFDAGVADFSGIGTSEDGLLYISNVIHKTHISVMEHGTKAGAVTSVEMATGAVMVSKEITFNRPFIYAIMDNNTNLPVFIGTVMDID